MKLSETSVATPMLRLTVEEEDWAGLGPAEAKRLLTLLLGGRRFEEAIFALDRRGLVHGPAHSSIGQEGGAAGCIAALPRDAMMNGSHRAHHQCVAKTLHALYGDDLDPARVNRLPDDMRREVSALLSEILGLKDGWTGGRGGSMHLRNDELGIMGTNAIVAGGMPIACGIAFAEKARQSGRIMVSFFGDGTLHQGTAHESLNLAALYDLPLIFFLENNGYAVSMSVEQSTRETNLQTRAAAQGIPSIRVDGMDPFAVWLAVGEARRRIEAGGGPVLILADVYRYYHQSVPFPGSSFGYRSKEEEETWRRRDPVDYLKAAFIERDILSKAEMEAIDAVVQEAVDAAVGDSIEGKGSRAAIRNVSWPDPTTVDEGICSDGSEFAGVAFRELEDFAESDLEEARFIDVMSSVVTARMEEDPEIYIFGEDVANMGGGTVGATKGMAEKFPGRVVNTPISENGFCGLAVGAAARGLRPVVELMYSDFVLVAADQLFNQAAKVRHLFGGKPSVPLVLRCRVPGAEGYGSQHSMDPAGLFALYPGWRIVAPSTPFDYAGLMNSALKCEDPVLVIEYQGLHKTKGRVPRALDHHLPIGRAKRVVRGHQITLLATLAMVERCREVAARMGISADIIDLRTLSPRDIDYDLIGESLAETNNIAIVEETTRGTSLGAIISDEIQRRFFDHLDQPVKRVVGGWASPVVSKTLERAALAGEREIAETLEDMLRDSAQRPALAS